MSKLSAFDRALGVQPTDGRLRPGVPGYGKGDPSPNPKGQGSKSHRFAALCREKSPEALEKIVECMRQTDDMRLAHDAAKTIIERGFGKAPMTVNLDSDKPITLVQMTDEQLMAMATQQAGVLLEHDDL
jgi:hypothetical protein